MNNRVAMTRFVLPAILFLLMISTPFRMALAEGAGGMLLSSAAAGAVRESVFADPGTGVEPERPVSAADSSLRLEPWKVAMISTAVPGFGQIYNDAAWKLPIYYGLVGYFAWRAIESNSRYNDYRFAWLSNPSAPDADAVASLRDDYRETRNRHIVFLCLAYVAGIVDAYVDAQLYGFDAITGEGLAALPSGLRASPIVSVHMNF